MVNIGKAATVEEVKAAGKCFSKTEGEAVDSRRTDEATALPFH